jgi:uncharacterized protein (DUF486 family)
LGDQKWLVSRQTLGIFGGNLRKSLSKGWDKPKKRNIELAFIRLSGNQVNDFPFLRRTPFTMNSLNPATTLLLTISLLTTSNLFMTFAWYGHLKHLSSAPLWVAVTVSWGIAFFEYVLQVPANRLGFSFLSLAQLKILQEVITLTVFIPFSIYYMQQPLKLDYLWAGLCIMGAVYFIFRNG